jgi:hypothetical protein
VGSDPQPAARQATRTCVRVVDATRSSGVRIPRKFRGSAAATTTGVESPAGASQEGHRVGQRVLFSVEAGHEASAPDLSTGFQHPQGAGDVPPGHRLPFPSQGLSKNDACPGEHPPRDKLGVFGRRRVSRLALKEAPASGRQAVGAPPRRRHDQPSQPSERIAGDAAQGDQLRQAQLDVQVQEPRRSDDLLEEHRTVRDERAVDLARSGR